MEWGELWVETEQEKLEGKFSERGCGCPGEAGVAGGCLAVYEKKCWQGQAGDQEAELRSQLHIQMDLVAGLWHFWGIHRLVLPEIDFLSIAREQLEYSNGFW